MSERVVTLEEVEDLEEAKGRVAQEGDMEGIHKAVVSFTPVTRYTTFQAEYAVKGADLVFHFFLTPEMDGMPKDGPVAVYWMRSFPDILDGTAQDFFRATAPRLQAKYTEEMASWWLRAQGFGENLDPEGLAESFLDQLDRDLDQSAGPVC